jgi:biotin carboxylase
MTVRIWFNHTYATNSHVMAMIRDNPDRRPVHIIGSHTDPDSPVLAASDESCPEPALAGGDYVEWALGFAGEHHVDVLVPRLAMAELCDARTEFTALGVTVAAPDAGTVRLFGDKAATYQAAALLGVPVPPHYVISDAAGLRRAYAELRALGIVCLKPVTGVGGAGFRILSTDAPSLGEFTGQVYPKADLDRLCTALDAAHEDGKAVTPIIVMPFLTGPEISVDALADRTGHTLAAIGRSRSRRRRMLVDDTPARQVAETLNLAHRVAYLSNTQVRYWQGPDDDQPLPYLLELNTRVSGGLFQTALTGVNLPWAAVQLALGEQVGPITPTYGGAFTTVSALVPLDDGGS